MDICTPTASHTASLAWGYARGIRRFMVEKPGAGSLVAWREQLARMPGAQVVVLHPYLFSRAFRIAIEAVPDVTDMTTVFNKDRRADDTRGRGAGADGALPHLFQVEVPHQLAMTLAVAPGLRVSHAAYGGRIGRGADPGAPVTATVRLEDSLVSQVTLRTDLSGERRRTLYLRNSAGQAAVVHFPTTPDLTARVWVRDRPGQPRLTFEGRDDLLRSTLVTMLHCLESGAVPLEASARFAATVLARMDEARHLADHGVPADRRHRPVQVSTLPSEPPDARAVPAGHW